MRECSARQVEKMPLENWEDGGGERGGEKGSARWRRGRARASHGSAEGRSIFAMEDIGVVVVCARRVPVLRLQWYNGRYGDDAPATIAAAIAG